MTDKADLPNDSPDATRDPSPKPTESGTSKICFVISPFGGWHDNYYREIYTPAIVGADLNPIRADSLFRSSNIVNDIWHYVTTSPVMLADLTGRNPNVYYELGLAHAARKPVLLLTQDIEDVPFDLRGLRIIPYDIQHPRWGEILQQAITQGLKETLESPETAVLPAFLQAEPEQQPRVAAEEKRFLDLQQQITSLRAQVRTMSSVRARQIFPTQDETRTLIEEYLREGMSPDDITESLIDAYDIGRDWLNREIPAIQARMEADRGTTTS